MADYGLEIWTRIKYIGLDTDPDAQMSDLLQRVEDVAELETEFRSSYLNEVIIRENDDGSYNVDMYIIEWGPFAKGMSITGDAEIIDDLPIDTVSGTVDDFVGDDFGERLYLPS